MITFLISFLSTLYLVILASRAVHYWQLADAQAKKIALQQTRLADQAAQIAELQSMLAASETKYVTMARLLGQFAEVACEQDAQIVELRSWLAIVMPKAMCGVVGRWN